VWFCLLVFNKNLDVLGVVTASQEKGSKEWSIDHLLMFFLSHSKEIHLPTGLETLSRCDIPTITNCCLLLKN